MNELFKYVLYKLLWSVIQIELILIFTITLGITLARIYYYVKSKWDDYIESRLSDQILELYLKQKEICDFNLKWRFRGFKLMIETLERFEMRFSDAHWDKVKQAVVEKYLINRAHRNVQKFFWLKRQLAARCFLLTPEMADEKSVEALLHDKVYLVRIVAAACIVDKLSNKQLFYQVLETMSNENAHSRFSYRDAIIHAGREKFDWIVELLKMGTPDESIIEICLDILIECTCSNLEVAIKFAKHQNPKIRLQAIRILGKVPIAKSYELLMESLSDECENIRVAALKSIASLNYIEAADNVSASLDDPTYVVRLEAALTLRSFGEIGIYMLSDLKKRSKSASEVCQYALELPLYS
ncbi:MAG: HEAT repeat domain-containing protein [Waddliaceae bacterium]